MSRHGRRSNQIHDSPENDEISPAEHQQDASNLVNQSGAFCIKELAQLGGSPGFQQLQYESRTENDGEKHEGADFVATHVSCHYGHRRKPENPNERI